MCKYCSHAGALSCDTDAARSYIPIENGEHVGLTEFYQVYGRVLVLTNSSIIS